MLHSAPLRKCIILALLGILCYHRGEAFEGNDFGDDQIAMESAPSFSSYPQAISILPAPHDVASKYNPSNDNSEDLPSPAALKSPSELRKSTSRTFKNGKPVVLIDQETGLPLDPEERRKYLANPSDHKARNNYSYINTNSGTLFFGTGNPYYYLNFTDTQTNTFAALGNAALFLGSLLVLGNLPASTLGLRNRNDDQLAHRVGPIGSRPPPDVLRPPPRIANPLVEGIRSYQRGVQSVLPKKHRRPNNQRQGTFGGTRTKRPKQLMLPPVRQSLQLLNPVAGVRRLRKKVGNALKEYTYRKRGSGRKNVYRGDRRGQNIESTNVRPSRHPHHRHYPLPLPPMSDVVTSSMRKRNRYNRKKQPVYFDDLPDYGSGIYETGVVLEPIRPSVDDPMYYDEPEYTFEDYNDIPLTPPTSPPVKRHKPRLSDTFRNDVHMYEERPQSAYRNRNRGSRYPLALGSTATTTTHRPYPNEDDFSSEALTSTDTLDLNINPYADHNTHQYEPKPYPTMTNSLYPPSISSTSTSTSENDLNGADDSSNRVRNKKRKLNKARRLKRRRRPNQKRVVINKETPSLVQSPKTTQDPLIVLEKLRKDRIPSYNTRGSSSPSYDDGDRSSNYGPTLNNPFGPNSFPTPTASWMPASDTRYSGGEETDRGSSGQDPGFTFGFEGQGLDPFEQMSKDFDGGNDEWISTISKAFEGFSDFKKIQAESDLK